MEPDGRPLDSVEVAAAVTRAIDDIDRSDEALRYALLSDLLCAAWGDVGAQKQ